MAHLKSQWQVALISDPTFSSPTVDHQPANGVDLLSAMLSGLTFPTEYIARVRYFSDDGEMSAYSDSVPFGPVQITDLAYATDTEGRSLLDVVSLIDIALASGTPKTTFPQAAALADQVLATDLPTSNHFRRSDHRYILRSLVIDPILLLPPTTMTATS